MERKCLKTLDNVSPIKVSPIEAPVERVPIFYPEPPHYRPLENEYDYVPRKYSVDQYMKTPPVKDHRPEYAASKKR